MVVTIEPHDRMSHLRLDIDDPARRLREAEERIRSLERERDALVDRLAKIDACAPGAVCSYALAPDGEARMVFCTNAIEDLYGVPAEALRRSMSAWAANVQPEELARVNAGIAESAARVDPWHDVFRYTHPTRGARWMEGWSIPGPPEPDGTRIWHGFVMDITPRKLAEERAERLSRYYRALAATNEIIVRATTEAELFQRACEITMGLGGLLLARILEVDPARRVLRAVAFAGDPRLAAVPDLPIDPDLPLGRVVSTEAFRENRTSVQNDLRSRPDIEEHWKVAHALVGSAISLPLRCDGHPVALLTLGAQDAGTFDPETVTLLERLAQDISFGLEHRARVRELRSGEERYRQLVDNMEYTVYTTDREGRLTFVSSAASRLGFTPRDLVGRRLLDVVHPQDREAVASRREELMSGRSITCEARWLHPSGQARFLRISARPILEGDDVTGTQGVLVDLTRQRETEEQLRMAQKMEAIGRLAGGVAHDFNNLLMVIGSYTDMAIEALPPSSPIRADLAEVKDGSERAAALTRQLLAFSRKQVLAPRVLDVNDLIGGLRKMLARLIREDIELVVDLGPRPSWTEADAGQIEQVLMNLVVNARDAMPDGGVLRIATALRQVDAQASRPGGVSAGSYVVISVTDSGTGMDAATQARIFEPFFTTKAAGQGTGLGLATAYGIVQQSGGHILVSSEPGRGATFEIFLRSAPPRQTESRAPRPPAETAPGRETVLLVEDEEGVRNVTRRMLERGGYGVLTAGSGAEALGIAEEHGRGIHLLLTDVVMPGSNGRDVAERLTRLCPGLRVLYMSGYTDDVIAHRGVLEPGVHFIPKPFRPGALLAKVREVLDGS